MDKLQSAAALAARLAIAWIFVIEGADKIANYAGVGAYMAANGVSSALLPVVILTELGGGILIALGFFTRLAAVALAGFCVLTAVLFHWNFADAGQWIQFNKDIAIAGGFLALAAFGAGGWSLDALGGSKIMRGMRTLGGANSSPSGSSRSASSSMCR